MIQNIKGKHWLPSSAFEKRCDVQKVSDFFKNLRSSKSHRSSPGASRPQFVHHVAQHCFPTKF